MCVDRQYIKSVDGFMCVEIDSSSDVADALKIQLNSILTIELHSQLPLNGLDWKNLVIEIDVVSFSLHVFCVTVWGLGRISHRICSSDLYAIQS